MHAPLVAVAEPVMTAERRQSGLIQMIDQIDQKHDIAHKRLRESLVELKEQHENLLDSLGLLKDRVTSLEKTPIDMANVRLTTTQMAAILMAFLSVFFSIAGSWYTVQKGMDEQKREQRLLSIDVQDLKEKISVLTGRIK